MQSVTAVVEVHVDAAYNLARWLTRNDQDAQDVVQEASLRALHFADSFRGENAKAWFLTIVRNTCYSWLKRNRDLAGDCVPEPAAPAFTANHAMQKLEWRETVALIEALPIELRETLVLRELEGFSYQEIADFLDVPIGTVMSRLARARERLLQWKGEKK